ncbi:thioredoxin [Tumidithrix helvetica PCC 7403]|uniref:thioredoxin n=1 Tax=Tumidithrix helvetica TaxID=3457545 RepID=UPI003CC1CF36
MTVKKQFASFEEMIEGSEVPLLVDFYAPWCGPCQIMAPILEQVSAKISDTAQIVKINTDTYPSLATQYAIRALPTFVLFKNGQPVDRIEGVLTADQLYSRMQQWI